MRIKVNGETKIISSNNNESDLESVIKNLGYDSRLIVVEYNRTILPPGQWKEQTVKDEDSLEIVTIVGGGS